MLKTLVREPFLHFLVLGCVIYGGVQFARGLVDQRQIVVDQHQLRRIATTYARQYGHAPSKEELAALVDQYIREEIFYREGMALKLDEDDEIVRRRVAQKFRFLEQDSSMVDEPTEAQLRSYFERHEDKYLLPEQVSFTHVYFSPDRDGLEGARARAATALQALWADNPARAPDRGDRFPDLYDYSSMGKVELQRVFGDGEFADDLLAAPVGEWAGPFQSGYGWHLVRLTAKSAARLPNLTDVEDRVRADYIDDVRREKDLQAFEALRKKYRIVAEGGAHG